MCGISGVVSEALDPAERRAAVGRMCDAMVHRGPDDGGVADFPGATLGMRRLSIIDLSARGHQPMPNEDETVWLVFNGEAYNYQSLRREATKAGHRFRSETDSETVVHLYEDHGEECLTHLRGMFGLAIWDTRTREALLARDRLGIKPLYYATLPDGVVFASELRALLASRLVDAELDPAALDQYLSFGYVPPPRTILRGVRALLPGHLARVADGRISTRRWWALPPPGRTRCAPVDRPSQLRALLEESIRLHRLSDVSVGAFLSGGVDSASVVALMRRTAGEEVRTFSVGFGDGPARLNELTAARETAEALGTDHTEVVLSAADVAGCLDHAVASLDQPSFDGLNTYIVSKATRERGVTVALSGLGGDELFGGYDTYRVIPRWHHAVRLWGSAPLAARQGIGRLLDRRFGGRVGDDRARKLRRLPDVGSLHELYALARLTAWPSEARALYTDETAAEVAAAGAPGPRAVLEEVTEGVSGPWRSVSELELTTFMSWRLLRDTDAMSMAHSLEVRVPLIDHEVVEFTCGLPEGWEAQHGYPKRLLTESVSDLLPDGVVGRPKQGFAFPLEHWMRHELSAAVEDTLAPEVVRARGLFEPRAVSDLLRSFQAGREPYPAVWQLVVLERWMQGVLDGGSA